MVILFIYSFIDLFIFLSHAPKRCNELMASDVCIYLSTIRKKKMILLKYVLMDFRDTWTQ